MANIKSITVLVAGIMLLGIAPLANAGKLVAIDGKLRQQLEILNIKGAIELDTSTWPLSSEAIESALAKAKPSSDAEQKMIASIQQGLAQTQQSKIAVVANLNGDERAIVDSFDKNYNTVTPIGVTASHSGMTEQFDYTLQATLNANDDEPSRFEDFDGSYIGTKLGNHRLAFGSIPTWWGSGLDGSLIRSNAARPVTGFLLQRADDRALDVPVLSHLGKLNYQISAGQLQDYDAASGAKLIGMRMSIQPHPAVQIGLSRSIMWGGDGHDESLSSLGKAILGTYDNGGHGKDPANQLGGFDAQLNLAPLMQVPVSLYAQTIGEDEAGGLPAKKSYLGGVKGTVAFKGNPWLWHAEWANTYVDLDKANIMYRHSTYTDGYYQQGLPLGHAIGGDGKIVSVGLAGAINEQNKLGLKYANARVNQSNQTINAAFPTKQNLDIVEADWQYQYNDKNEFGVGVWGQRDRLADNNDAGGNLRYTYRF